MIGRRMQRLRVARGLTQAELASPKYTHSYVSTIEAGRRRPSRRALEHFAGRLGVSMEELETGLPPDLEHRLELRVHQARIDLSAGRLDDAHEALTNEQRDVQRARLTRVEAKIEEGLGLRPVPAGRAVAGPAASLTTEEGC